MKEVTTGFLVAEMALPTKVSWRRRMQDTQIALKRDVTEGTLRFLQRRVKEVTLRSMEA